MKNSEKNKNSNKTDHSAHDQEKNQYSKSPVYAKKTNLC